MRTAITAIAAALLTALALGGVSADAAGNPPVVNPLDINPFLVARDAQPCQSNGSSVPLVGQSGQFYSCQNNKWVAVKAFADPNGVRQAVGSVQYIAGTGTPTGYLPADGAAIDAAKYPALAARMAPATNVPTIPAGPGGAPAYIKALP